jgi:hypothetical protein
MKIFEKLYIWTTLEGLHKAKWNLLHGNCTDVHSVSVLKTMEI